MSKLIIGSYDKLDFPDFGLYNIRCKIDTGADTSSIHCHRVKIIERQGKDFLSFILLDPEHKLYSKKSIVVSNFCETVVKSSSGHSEMRYVVESSIIFHEQIFDITLTLADRSEMKYPVLIGRKFLKQNKILIDVSKTNLSYRTKSKKGAK